MRQRQADLELEGPLEIMDIQWRSPWTRSGNLRLEMGRVTQESPQSSQVCSQLSFSYSVETWLLLLAAHCRLTLSWAHCERSVNVDE